MLDLFALKSTISENLKEAVRKDALRFRYLKLYTLPISDGEFEVSQLEQLIKRSFMNQFFSKGQKVVADVSGYNLVFNILKVDVLDLESLTAAAAAGGKKKPAKKPETAEATPGEEGEEGAHLFHIT